MKNEKECKIVQDLLPNYIEKLTNKETNGYIEEHLSNCQECTQVLESMKENIHFEGFQKNQHEVQYLKKFNKKFGLLRNILILIISILVIMVIRKVVIFTNISQKNAKMNNDDNFYIKQQVFYDGSMGVIETYSMDDYTLIKKTTYFQDNRVLKSTIYKSEHECFTLIDDGENKYMNKLNDVITEIPSYKNNTIFQNLNLAINSSVKSTTLKGKACYLIKENNVEKFIDKNTGMIVKIIYNDIDSTVNYEYQYGTVTKDEVKRPDTNGYEVK